MQSACFLEVLKLGGGYWRYGRTESIRGQREQCWRIDGRKHTIDLPAMGEKQTLCFSLISDTMTTTLHALKWGIPTPLWRGEGLAFALCLLGTGLGQEFGIFWARVPAIARHSHFFNHFNHHRHSHGFPGNIYVASSPQHFSNQPGVDHGQASLEVIFLPLVSHISLLTASFPSSPIPFIAFSF